MKRAILVKQLDLTDCGAACLASVAAYYGLHIPVSRIRKYAGTNKQGTTLYGLLGAAEQLHFQARGAKTTGIDLKGIPVPTIFHLAVENGLQHFVVVYKIGKKRIKYMDPALGKLISLPLPAFEKKWSGIVILLIPSNHFRRGNEKKSVFIRFCQLIMPHRNMLSQALAGALVYTILGLSTSIYIQKTIDFVLPDANKHLMNILGLGMIVILCFQIVAGYFKSLIALRTGQQIDTCLILGYYKHLLKLPQRFFDSMRVGEIISRVNDALRIRIFINDVALSVIVHLLTMILSMTVMFIYYWKLALVMLLSIPVYGLMYFVSNRVNAKWQRKIMENGAALESQLVESIQRSAAIRHFGSASFFNLKTENSFIPFMRAVFTSSRSGLILSNVSEWITGIFGISILWAGSYLVIDRVLSPGDLLSFYTLTAFFTTPVQALIGVNRTLQDALIAADRLFEIIDLETESESNGKLTIERFPEGDLIFNNVQFSYIPGTKVFDGLKIRIPQNQITAVIGDSGCGKSTLLLLSQKFYPVNGGNIMIGEMDVQYISTSVLRQKIAAVPQHTDLFQESVISNIAMGEIDPDLERIFNICNRLGLHEFISGLPGRYQTIIREQGINLSGGQKQRLGIARALYRDPSILILDEATSALDPESESKVQETLNWFYNQKKTIIIITHRLKTIKYCDSIIFLSQGKPAVSGTHEKLLSENTEYAGWWDK
jgi:ATP-binding cassette, subfamily C, bacteriocin exporter